MRLSRLVVVEEPTEADWPLMLRVAAEAAADPHPGLPSHMREGVQFSVHMVQRQRSFVDYLFFCMFICQARPPGESDETIRLRLELQSIFFYLLYGSPAHV